MNLLSISSMAISRTLSFVFLVFLTRSDCILALDNGVALTPPMGWLQWERFACNIDCDNDPYNCISENLFMDMADHMVADGFLDAGYEYVNIDDCWSAKKRDENGTLQADPERFPHGIKYLADYVHEKGLKLGIYGDMGNKTCGGYPGSLGYVEKDADTFADWGIDMLKLDGCYASEAIYEIGYPEMSQALNKTGRPIGYSCSWPAYIKKPDYSLLAKICNLWRNYHDISDNWESVLKIISHYGDNQSEFQPFAGPGHWNDPDMLILGDYGLSIDQQKAQMALWAIFASPLLMSNDLRTISKESVTILLNKEIIAVNQDPLGIQGKLISTTNSDKYRVYSRPLKGGDVAVALLNTFAFSYPKNITFSFKDVGLMSNKANIRDLYASKDLGTFSDMYSVPVNPVGVRLFRVAPVT